MITSTTSSRDARYSFQVTLTWGLRVGRKITDKGPSAWKKSTVDAGETCRKKKDEALLSPVSLYCVTMDCQGAFTAWCSEIGSLVSLDAPEFHAISDVRETISLHQAVLGMLKLNKKNTQSLSWCFFFLSQVEIAPLLKTADIPASPLLRAEPYSERQGRVIWQLYYCLLNVAFWVYCLKIGYLPEDQPCRETLSCKTHKKCPLDFLESSLDPNKLSTVSQGGLLHCSRYIVH